MTILFIMGGLSALYLGILLSARWPILPLITTSAFVCSAWESPLTPTLTYAIGSRVSAADALTAVLATTAIANFAKKRPRTTVRRGVLAVLVALTVLAAISGTVSFGFGAAFNEGRLVILPLACLVWAISVNWLLIPKSALEKWLLLTGWGLTVAAVYHGFFFGIGDASSQVEIGSGEYQTGRVLVSGQAVVLLICLYFTFGRWMHEHKNYLFLSAVAFATTIVITQHRSVWLAFAVTMIAVWLVSSNASKERALVTVFAVVVVLACLKLTSAVDGFYDDLLRSLEDDRTYEARQGSWVQLVRQYVNGSASDILRGFPFGFGFRRVEPNGVTVSYQPHNWYVTLLLRTGFIGLSAWLLLLLSPMKHAWINNRTAELASIITVGVYSWTYAINWYLGVFLGIAISLSYLKGTSARQSSVSASDIEKEATV